MERGKLAIENFEPIYLTPSPARPTEYGKRWMQRVWNDLDRHSNTIRDVAALGQKLEHQWPTLERLLAEEGVPTAITSGISQYGMSRLIDHLNGKTSFIMPATVAIALATAVPTSTTTGASVVEAVYTGYARVTTAGAVYGAATAATPSVSTSASPIIFGACAAGTSTLLGFLVVDSATIGAGNALWYGTLASTVISATQTPPTIAAGSLVLQMTGT